MAYQVLARKWRPHCFADLVGQEHVVGVLRNAFCQGRLHHAWLFTGTRGVGKTTIARIIAKSLNCDNPDDGEPCGKCSACTQIDAGKFIDVFEIDAASHTGIDNMKEVLEHAVYAPTVGKYKVYIIDEVHMLSKSAFNAMLKTLEEPPEHVKFILATTELDKVPITILSRCLQFVLRNLTIEQIFNHLKHILIAEEISFEEQALKLIARAANGSMRDALSLLDQSIAFGSGEIFEDKVRQMLGVVDKSYLIDLLVSISKQDKAAVFANIKELAINSVGFDNVLNELSSILLELAILQVDTSTLVDTSIDVDRLKQLAQDLSAEEIQLYYQCVINGKQNLSLAPDEYSGFLMTVLRMLSFAPLTTDLVLVNQYIDGTELASPK